MKYKWHIFWIIIFFCGLGTMALGYIAHKSPPPESSSTFIEVTKTIFLCLGGLGVILPLYINAINTIEGRESTKIENTFSLITKWDDPHLFAARKLTRDIKDKRSSISDDDLVKQIKENPELRQSVILVINYFELVRFSILNNRIDNGQFSASVGPVIIDIIHRFRPFFKSLGEEVIRDLEQLEGLLK